MTRSKVESVESSAERSEDNELKVEEVPSEIITENKEPTKADEGVSKTEKLPPKKKSNDAPRSDDEHSDEGGEDPRMAAEATETKCNECGDDFSSKEILKMHSCHSLWIRHGAKRGNRTTEIEINNTKGEPCECCLGNHNKYKNLSFNLKTQRWSNDVEPMTRGQALVRAKQMLNMIIEGKNTLNIWFKCIICDRWSDDLGDIQFGHDEMKEHIIKYHRTTVEIYQEMYDKCTWKNEVILRRFQNILMNKHDEEYDYQLWRTSPMWRKITQNKSDKDEKD